MIAGIDKMRIFPKLLMVLLSTSIALLVILYAFMQWSVDRSMLNYVNQRQIQSLQLVSDNLAAVYQEHQGWQEIVASSLPPHVRDMNNSQHRPKFAEPRRRPTKRERKPQPFNHPDGPKLTAEQLNYQGVEYWRIVLKLSEQGLRYPEDVEQLGRDDKPRRQRKKSRNVGYSKAFDNTPPKPRENNQQAKLRFSLLDAEENLLIGQFKQGFVKKAITVNKAIVGYVAIPATEQITDSFDLQFVEDINQKILLILAGIFTVIVLITIPLSRHFVSPITRLKKAVIKVNQGELSTRLPILGSDELAILARNFNDLAATLEQNEVSRKRWLADIAHELRTPLAIIKGELEAMEDGVRPINIQNITSLSEEVNHLQSLINDLNELNQAEIGAMRYQKSALNIVQLLTLNAQRHKVLLKNQGLVLTIDIPDKKIVCWADATRMNQLFDNLFANSAKYTDAPGQVHCHLIENQEDVDIFLEDSKPGVANEDLEKLFEHLYRVENSRNRKTGGSGIGLALCKNIVYAHQGKISAHQASNGGLMIKISLPKN